MADSTTPDAVATLIAQGYTVIPIVAGLKKAAVLWNADDYTQLPPDFWADTDYDVALVTGKGFFVVDVDDWDAWLEVCAVNGWDANKPTGARGSVATPSGGRHFYYRIPEDFDGTITNANTFPKGIDVRGAGGYVVAPPTRGYVWL